MKKNTLKFISTSSLFAFLTLCGCDQKNDMMMKQKNMNKESQDDDMQMNNQQKSQMQKKNGTSYSNGSCGAGGC